MQDLDGPLGYYVEGAFLWRWFRFRHEEWLKSDPSVASSDHIRFNDVGFMTTVYWP